MIKFGTSGWRGIIADDFTFGKVRIVTQAIAEYVKSQDKGNNTVIIGYDPRFLSEKFAQASAEVLAGNDIKVLLCKRDNHTRAMAIVVIR